MEGERTQRAIARIEAAVARIERASSQRTVTAAGASDPELERKYAELRSETGAALAELDRLLGAIAP